MEVMKGSEVTAVIVVAVGTVVDNSLLLRLPQRVQRCSLEHHMNIRGGVPVCPPHQEAAIEVGIKGDRPKHATRQGRQSRVIVVQASVVPARHPCQADLKTALEIT
jgi:hypothetical protein